MWSLHVHLTLRMYRQVPRCPTNRSIGTSVECLCSALQGSDQCHSISQHTPLHCIYTIYNAKYPKTKPCEGLVSPFLILTSPLSLALCLFCMCMAKLDLAQISAILCVSNLNHYLVHEYYLIELPAPVSAMSWVYGQKWWGQRRNCPEFKI